MSLVDIIVRANLSATEQSALLDGLVDYFDRDALSDFVKSHISYEDALQVVQSDDQFYDDFMPKSDEPITDAIVAAPKDVAYSLVFSHPNAASQLFEELLYYRNKGRI